MRPYTTLLTSTELQQVLGNPLDDEEMDDLQAFRDDVQERFRQHLEALSVMEEEYGEAWEARDLDIYIADTAGNGSASAPIILDESDKDTAFFMLLYLLGKNLVRSNPPEQLEYADRDTVDVAAAVLTKSALEDVMEAESTAVMDAAQDRLGDAFWDAVTTLDDDWDDDEPLKTWFDGDSDA